MHLPSCSLILFTCVATVEAVRSKRGLIVLDVAGEQTDLSKYLDSPLLKWVYNYSPQPAAPGNGYPYGNMSFVPMLWGETNSNTFLSVVKAGQQYDAILTFNEPDMPQSVGGSQLSVDQAISIWKTQIQPLENSGYKLGSPAGSSLKYSCANNKLQALHTEHSGWRISLRNAATAQSTLSPPIFMVHQLDFKITCYPYMALTPPCPSG